MIEFFLQTPLSGCKRGLSNEKQEFYLDQFQKTLTTEKNHRLSLSRCRRETTIARKTFSFNDISKRIQCKSE
jgi:hypothetical protein